MLTYRLRPQTLTKTAHCVARTLRLPLSNGPENGQSRSASYRRAIHLYRPAEEPRRRWWPRFSRRAKIITALVVGAFVFRRAQQLYDKFAPLIVERKEIVDEVLKHLNQQIDALSDKGSDIELPDFIERDASTGDLSCKRFPGFNSDPELAALVIRVAERLEERQMQSRAANLHGRVIRTLQKRPNPILSRSEHLAGLMLALSYGRLLYRAGWANFFLWRKSKRRAIAVALDIAVWHAVNLLLERQVPRNRRAERNNHNRSTGADVETSFDSLLRTHFIQLGDLYARDKQFSFAVGSYILALSLLIPTSAGHKYFYASAASMEPTEPVLIPRHCSNWTIYDKRIMPDAMDPNKARADRVILSSALPLTAHFDALFKRVRAAKTADGKPLPENQQLGLICKDGSLRSLAADPQKAKAYFEAVASLIKEKKEQRAKQQISGDTSHPELVYE